MYENNIHVILNLMAVYEIDVAYRACTMGKLPIEQYCLRWTVEEEARQMVHIFDDLSTVRFNLNEKGVIRQTLINRVAVAVADAYTFYYKYQKWDKWSEKVREVFNQLVYLRAVKLAEIATGIRMDFNWMDTTLRKYGERPHTISLNKESQELKERICRGEFEPTEDEVNMLSEVLPDLEKSMDDVLTNLYGYVYITVNRMWYYDMPIALGSYFRG